MEQVEAINGLTLFFWRQKEKREKTGPEKGSINRRHFRTCWGYFTGAKTSSSNKYFISCLLFCLLGKPGPLYCEFGNIPVMKNYDMEIKPTQV